MRKTIPEIRTCMTTALHSVGADQSIEKADALMKRYSIRHLPVLKSGSLVGIVSERDVKVARSIRGVDPAKTLVDEIANEDVYITEPDRPISEVVTEMANRQIGSAIVVENHKLVGIFTSTDALRILGQVLGVS